MRVEFTESEPETFLLPLRMAGRADAERIATETPAGIFAQLQNPSTAETGVLYDASLDPLAATTLLKAMVRRRRLKGLRGELVGWSASELLGNGSMP